MINPEECFQSRGIISGREAFLEEAKSEEVDGIYVINL